MGKAITPFRFFFSSRRRHTRFDCDWSSDVCSSDLAPNVSMVNAGPLPPESRTRGLRGTAFYDAVWVACTDKLATEAGRKTLVIITDADDQGRKVELKEAIEGAERTDAVILILLVLDPGYGTRPDVAKKMAEE